MQLNFTIIRTNMIFDNKGMNSEKKIEVNCLVIVNKCIENFNNIIICLAVIYSFSASAFLFHMYCS